MIDPASLYNTLASPLIGLSLSVRAPPAGDTDPVHLCLAIRREDIGISESFRASEQGLDLQIALAIAQRQESTASQYSVEARVTRQTPT